MFLFLMICLCLFFLMLYFLPAFIAIGRKHSHMLQITLLNAFLGWSFFGWVAALIWSTTSHVNEDTSTKASWIIVVVFILTSLFPLITISGLFLASDIMIDMPKDGCKIIKKIEINKVSPKIIEIKKEVDEVDDKD